MRRTRRCARAPTPSSSRSSWPWPPSSSVPMARTSASTTSPGSSGRRSRSSPRSARGPAGSRSAPRSSTCATRTRCTWPRTPGAADLIAGGRLQLGISRGSPEQVDRRVPLLRVRPGRGRDRRRHGPPPRRDVPRHPRGEGFAEPNPRPMFANPPGLLRVEPHSPGLRDRIWWGAASDATAVWAAKLGREPAELDPEVRRDRRAAPLQQRKQIEAPGGVEGRRSRARAARLGQPQHLRARRRPRSGVLRARDERPATRSAISTRRRGRSSGAPTPPSPTCWSRSVADGLGIEARPESSLAGPSAASCRRPGYLANYVLAASRRSGRSASSGRLVDVTRAGTGSSPSGCCGSADRGSRPT